VQRKRGGGFALEAALKRFLEPQSVAVIGASATPGKGGNDIIRNIQSNDYRGSLYLVNPRGGEILGVKVFKSISDLPAGIDLAVLVLPASSSIPALKECAKRAIKAAVLVAGGFAEVDDQGGELQEAILNIVRETGIRVLGPNTSGLLSMPQHLAASFFPLGKIPRGNLSYIAQTGNFATHSMRYIMSAENYGVARVIGLGNKVDVEESEVLEYLGADPATKAIMLYLESFKRPRRFLEVARKVTRHKPVLLLKGGSTEKGAKAAVTHTAAMAADDRLVSGALRQAGVIRMFRYSDLVLVAKALALMPLPKGRGVGVLAPSGAMAVCMADLCDRDLNLRVTDLEEKSLSRLQSISPTFIRMRNPVDIWPSATLHGPERAYREGMETLLMDPRVDAVVSILMVTDETGVPPLDFMADLSRRFPEKPIYVSCSGQKKHMEAAKAFLEPRGVPTFWFAEEALEALSFAVQCREAMERGRTKG
jgi:acyl-CoA synthetase (NDP forming)